MGAQHITLRICRHQGIQRPFEIEHQRMVLEAITMVIHVVTIEEKRAVLGFRNELIPLISLIGGVPDNLEHVFCQL